MIEAGETVTSAAVADHYDDLDPFYRALWGSHVHHGYWARGDETPERAVEALVDLLADRIGVRRGDRLCDVGCGYGATAAYLAATREVSVVGLTLSGVQAARAAALAAADGRLSLRRGDWLANDLPDDAFDGVTAIESSEHMPDKARFFAEARRVLKPGGRLGVCAWLAAEGARPWEVRRLLEPICREGRMPSMGTEADYRRLAAAAGLEVERFDDVSRAVRRTWTICARRFAARVATDGDLRRYLRSGASRNRVFALTLVRLIVAYRTGAMRYGVMIARRPA